MPTPGLRARVVAAVFLSLILFTPLMGAALAALNGEEICGMSCCKRAKSCCCRRSSESGHQAPGWRAGSPCAPGCRQQPALLLSILLFAAREPSRHTMAPPSVALPLGERSASLPPAHAFSLFERPPPLLFI